VEFAKNTGATVTLPPAAPRPEPVLVVAATVSADAIAMTERTQALLKGNGSSVTKAAEFAATMAATPPSVRQRCTRCGTSLHTRAECTVQPVDEHGNPTPDMEPCSRCGRLTPPNGNPCGFCVNGYTAPTDWNGEPRGAKAEPVNGTAPQPDLSPTSVSEREESKRDPSITVLPNLPDKFWDSRDILRQIRQGARAAQAGPDIVLLAVMCRLSAMTSHRLIFNLGLGKGSLGLFGGAVGGTGLGKTMANHAAQDLLLIPTYLTRKGTGEADPRKFKDSIGIGTGEGLIEAYMGFVEEETGEVHTKNTKNAKIGDPVTERVRRQVRHNAYFFVDEGEILAKLMERSGQTLGPIVRSAWAGAALGQELADSDRTRWIARLSYALGMVIGFQPEVVQHLLADGAAGTPQRFLWMSGYDLDLPDTDFDEVPPLRIPIENPDGTPLVGTITGPEWLRKELRARRARLLRAEESVRQLDSHEILMRCKVSALLALLDGGRTRVLDDDWELAGMVWDTSAAIRDQLTEIGRQVVATTVRQKTEAAAEVAATVHAAVRGVDADVEKAARWLAKRVHDSGGDTERGPRRDMEGKLRKHYDLALDRAVRAEWIVQDGGHLLPGSVRPV
jgi:hypothetical protein